VPGRVKRAGWWFKAYLAAELLRVAEDISPGQLGSVPGDEDKPMAGRICNVTHQPLSEFGTERNDARLAALPVQPHQQIVKVNGFPAKDCSRVGYALQPRLPALLLKSGNSRREIGASTQGASPLL
jgi:hypothetical protein